MSPSCKIGIAPHPIHFSRVNNHLTSQRGDGSCKHPGSPASCPPRSALSRRVIRPYVWQRQNTVCFGALNAPPHRSCIAANSPGHARRTPNTGGDGLRPTGRPGPAGLQSRPACGRDEGYRRPVTVGEPSPAPSWHSDPHFTTRPTVLCSPGSAAIDMIPDSSLDRGHSPRVYSVLNIMCPLAAESGSNGAAE